MKIRTAYIKLKSLKIADKISKLDSIYQIENDNIIDEPLREQYVLNIPIKIRGESVVLKLKSYLKVIQKNNYTIIEVESELLKPLVLVFTIALTLGIITFLTRESLIFSTIIIGLSLLIIGGILIVTIKNQTNKKITEWLK